MPETPVSVIAGFQHRNESMHRHHDLDKPTCSYCDLIGINAVASLEQAGYVIVERQAYDTMLAAAAMTEAR